MGREHALIAAVPPSRERGAVAARGV